MSDEIRSAIAKLQAEHDEDEQAFRDAERNMYGKRIAINTLFSLLGEPPPYPGAGAGGEAARSSAGGAAKKAGADGATPSAKTMTIRPDSFYGKRQQTAVREFLEMRKLAGQGPATPREIFDALKTGGFQYEAKEDTTALVGLRALLRKRTAFFHRLPNGTYGLTSWYPDAKKPKGAVVAAAHEDDDEPDTTDTEDQASEDAA